jgi:hypothetical protein
MEVEGEDELNDKNRGVVRDVSGECDEMKTKN